MRTVLAGRGILVTRPAHQAEPLCRLLSARGARPIRFPALAIGPPRNPAAARRVLTRLERYHIAIFISVNAVEQGLAMAGELPAELRLAVIGQASAKALAAQGYSAALRPASVAASEALLAAPELQNLARQRVLIVRGEGGRETLAETLRARGATVDYAEVYRRLRPPGDVAALLAYWSRGELDAVTATSNETLHNLYAMTSAARDRLLATPLVVASRRAQALATELGWRAPVAVAAGAEDEAMVAALEALLG